MNNKDLIRQYVDTGRLLPEYQLDRLSNNDKNTYIRKRLIAIDAHPENNLASYEYDLVNDPQSLIKIMNYSLAGAWQYINPKTYTKDIAQFPEAERAINRLRVLYRDDNKVKTLILDKLLDGWLENGIDIPFEILQNLPESTLRKYSNTKLDKIFYYGNDDLIYDKWMLKYGGETIQKYLDRIKKDGMYFSDKVKTWAKKDEKTFLSLMEVFMTNPELNQSLDERDFAWMLVEAPDKTHKQIFTWYLKNGGNIEMITQNPFLNKFYNKAFAHEQ